MQRNELANDDVDRSVRCPASLHARIAERARLRGASVQDEAVRLMEAGLMAAEVEGRSLDEIVGIAAQMTGERILSGLLLAASGCPGGLTQDMILGILKTYLASAGSSQAA